MEEYDMSFALFTDSCSNLPIATLRDRDLQVIPLTYTLDGEEHSRWDVADGFDGQAFYTALKEGRHEVHTSMVNTAAFLDAFAPALQAGQDLLYVGISSGISGTSAAAESAAALLREQFPQREILVADTHGASLGEGLTVLEAARLRDEGRSAREVWQTLMDRRARLCQHFVVDDLMFLRRGGRVSATAAIVGTLVGIRPLLRGDEGRIVQEGKCRGRRRALETLRDIYLRDVRDPAGQTVGIAHADCEKDALYLRQLLMDAAPCRDVIVQCYEPVTGAHVGPGTVALFFWGENRPL